MVMPRAPPIASWKTNHFNTINLRSIVKFENSCHWYQCRSGSPEPQHDADLRVARKAQLYPSITTVLKDEFKNDFLDRWKTNELLLAAAASPRQPHDTDESYTQRIYDLSLDKAKTAADFGKEIHDAIENYPSISSNESIAPWISHFAKWYDSNVDHPLHREEILYDHALGLAGRCDFIGRGKGPLEGKVILPDWKTQNVKKDEKGRKKPAFYDSWPRQLAFYASAYAKKAGTFPDLPICISVVIDSNEPCEPFVKVWEKEEILSGYEDVLIAAYRWFKKRKYWPQPEGPFKVGFNLPLPT